MCLKDIFLGALIDKRCDRLWKLRNHTLVWSVHAQVLSCVQLFVTLWTVTSQVPVSVGFSRQEYWSGLPCPPPGESSPPRDRTRVSYASLCVCECVCLGQRDNLKQKFVHTIAMEDIYFSCMLNKIISSEKGTSNF